MTRLSRRKAAAAALLSAAVLASAVPECGADEAPPSPPAVVSSLDDLPYDENGRLAVHALVYPAGECADLILKRYPDGRMPTHGFRAFPVAGEASDRFFAEAGADVPEDPSSLDDCPAVCQERGVDRPLVHAAIPKRRHEAQGSFNTAGSFNNWFERNCRRVEVGFMNYHSKSTPVKMHWLSPFDGAEHNHGELKYGERNTRCFDSFLGHTFRFRDGDTGELLLEHTVEFVTMRGIGPGVGPYETGGRNFAAEIRRTHASEWSRHDRVKRTFSALGFRKGRLPDDIYASMGAFYYNNRDYREKEEWSHKGVFVNWWEVDVYFVQIPWGLKGLWQERLMELVEAWTGTELEQTDMYGLRRYEEGARLLTHVDREATHAASLIVNVAQGNVSKPWPVEVYDHGDRLHEVPMEPGDIVYYESARCLHGRNRPLEGRGAYYVNLFTHYRPKGDPRWYDKPNPEGTPEPLVDVGECRLVGKPDEFGQGAVECDDDRVGPYLSPTMYSAKGGDSLQKWWEMVSPEPKAATEDGAEGASAEGGKEL